MRKSLCILAATIMAAMYVSPMLADGVEVTDKLVNASGTDKLMGWTIDITTCTNMTSGNTWKSGNYSEVGNTRGMWDFSAPSFESWGQVPGGMTISQTVTDLPNGVYVFGAYTVVWEGESKVYMFANGDSTWMPTLEYYPKDFAANKKQHVYKYYAATTVTDGKLTVGITSKPDNGAKWLAADSFRLFYYTETSQEDAVLVTRQHDIEEVMTTAQGLLETPMTAEGLDSLTQAIAKVGELATLEACDQADEDLRWGILHARNAVSSMQSLLDLVAKAKEVAAGDWSDAVADQVKQLNEAIEEVEAAIAAKTIDAAALAGCKQQLNDAMGMVRMDELWDVYDALAIFLDDYESIDENYPCFGLTSHPGFGEEDGQYSLSQYESLSALLATVSDVLGQMEDGTMSITDGLKYIDVVNQAVAACIASVSSTNTLPLDYIIFPDPEDPTIPYCHWRNNSDILSQGPILARQFNSTLGCGDLTCFRVESTKFHSNDPIKVLRLTVLHTVCDQMPGHYSTQDPLGDDGPYFGIHELYIFDKEGNRIELTADDFTSNAKESGQGTYAGLCDCDLGKEFYSRWMSEAQGTGPHNLSITLPEPMYDFSIAIEETWDKYQVADCPTEIYIEGMTEGEGLLDKAINYYSGYRSAVPGTDPGYYAFDMITLKKCYDAAVAVKANPDATEAEKMNAAQDLLDAYDACGDASNYILPEAGVEFNITSAYTGFMENQHVRKCLTVFQDSILWWEDADPSSDLQKFTFERVECDWDANPHFYIKNVGTGLYLGSYTNIQGMDADGNAIVWANTSGEVYAKTSDMPQEWSMTNLGGGCLALHNLCLDNGQWIMTTLVNHNNGVATEDQHGSAGGGKSVNNPDGYSIRGVNGVVGESHSYQYEGSISAWYINHLQTLPTTVAVSDDFTCYHFTTGSKIFTFTANKATAFADFKLYNNKQQELTFDAKRGVNTITVTLDAYVADFYFSFTNNEGVASIEISATESAKTKLDEVREAYNKYVGSYYPGDGVGFYPVAQVEAYEQALEQVETLLTEGGSDDACDAAIKALADAVGALVMNEPELEQKYMLIDNNHDFFYPYYGKEMAVYYNMLGDKPGWTYADEKNEAFYWLFEKGDREGTWYVKSALSGKYLTDQLVNNGMIGTEVPTAFILVPQPAGTVAFRLADGAEGAAIWMDTEDAYSYWGYGRMFYWYSVDAFAQYHVVPATSDETKVYQLEDLIEAAPAQEGIYDLTGRRVSEPTVTGLYIVDGKKVFIKKD